MGNTMSAEELRRSMVIHKLDQNELKPEYVPPEGKQGQGGPDAQTELAGFHHDYEDQMLKILDKFPRGGDVQEIGQFLTDEAARQQSRSAGSYIRATMLELRDIVVPDYHTNIAMTTVQPLPAADAIAALKAGSRGIEFTEMLQEVERKLAPDATAKTIETELGRMSDSFYNSGDDYAAETADIMKGSLKKITEESRGVQIKQGATTLRNEERERYGIGVVKPEIATKFGAAAPPVSASSFTQKPAAPRA